jgi:CDP-glucose 4,6-dehydratase
VAVGPRALEAVVSDRSQVTSTVPGTAGSPDAAFWRGKRVLLTGHTGFKGAWLALWLRRLGADVAGLALAPAQPSLYALAGLDAATTSRIADLRDPDAVARVVREARPQIVFHLAAQALVRASYREPLATFATNMMGTAHLLEALRSEAEVRVAVVVTTDKVYRNREWVYPYREDDALGGHDPYSASKAAAELVAASYRSAFLQARGIALATARAGNVIGGGDWSEDRLIPDAVRAWSSGAVLRVRHADAVRPWQHVLDPLAGYLRLAESLWQAPTLADAYNFGPRTDEAATVGDVIRVARAAYGRGDWRDETEAGAPHEAGRLALEVARARDVLGVSARWSLAEAIGRTMRWYRGFADGAAPASLCAEDIEAFERAGTGIAATTPATGTAT